MASLIPGFEYDVFISYRQKDNKGDRWVSVFVEALKTELESTFKEEISVYFDINPHDGLLETHDVDASLKEKLKCLIFIPIISRTYCDPKSFAWEHEFKAFVELASKDQFGLKVKLSNSNVANRVLPVRIHDLDNNDIELCESILGGVMRGMEFIYKESGFNRPLNPDDDEKNNLNKTKYRNQITKVALAIKEIISSIGSYEQNPEEVTYQVTKPKSLSRKYINTKIFASSVILLGLIILGFFLIPKLFISKEHPERSIAVLPFKLLSDEPDKQYLADGMMDAILLHLQKFSDLRVLSRTSVEQYRETNKTTRQIGQELGVEYLLEGSFQKSGDNVRLIVQLIKARKDESHAWANEYDRNWKDIFSVQSEVAQTIAYELHTIITPAENELIKRVPTTNLAAYDLYLKANDYQKDYQKTQNVSSYQTAVTFYKAALKIDSAFSEAYTGLANAFWNRYYNETYFNQKFLDTCLVLANKALSFDNKLDEAYYLKGEYYRINGNIDEALDNYDEALKSNPNYYLAYNAKGYVLTWVIKDFVKGIEHYQKALNLIRGDERQFLLEYLGRAYLDVGFADKAKYYFQESLTLNGDSSIYYTWLANIQWSLGNYQEALKLAKRANEIDSTTFIITDFYICLPSAYKEEVYLNAAKLVELKKKSGELNLQQSHRVGYAFWQVGRQKEAKYYFEQQIKYGEESMKLERDIAQKGAAQYDLAGTYAFLGKKEKAYQYLDEFDKMNSFPLWWVTLIKNDPLFNNIRNESRFQQIVREVESKYHAEHERVRKWLEEQDRV